MVGCTADLKAEGKMYNLKKHLCHKHMHASAVRCVGYGDKLCRFCFQCGKLEPLARFAGEKRQAQMPAVHVRSPARTLAVVVPTTTAITLPARPPAYTGAARPACCSAARPSACALPTGGRSRHAAARTHAKSSMM